MMYDRFLIIFVVDKLFYFYININKVKYSSVLFVGFFVHLLSFGCSACFGTYIV